MSCAFVVAGGDDAVQQCGQLELSGDQGDDRNRGEGAAEDTAELGMWEGEASPLMLCEFGLYLALMLSRYLNALEVVRDFQRSH